MTVEDYYGVLGISSGSSIDEIKKAYRLKARMYHPDINPSPDAKDMFISATEAYEFLIANFNKITDTDEAYRQAMEDWRKYRQDRSRQRATAYSRASYVKFKNTKFYRSTRIFDGTTIIFSLIISIMVIVGTIFGYIIRLKNPMPELNTPPFFSFIMLLFLGMTFFVLSLVNLKVYIESSKKKKQKSK
jgi:curved DNA-binding protein CbpA